MAGLDPAIPTGIVAAYNSGFRNVRAGEGRRVKPGHDGLGRPARTHNVSMPRWLV